MRKRFQRAASGRDTQDARAPHVDRAIGFPRGTGHKRRRLGNRHRHAAGQRQLLERAPRETRARLTADRKETNPGRVRREKRELRALSPGNRPCDRIIHAAQIELGPVRRLGDVDEL